MYCEWLGQEHVNPWFFKTKCETLEEAKRLKIYKVLFVALETNTPSNKVIQKCGGILENKVKDSDNSIINRYWISIS